METDSVLFPLVSIGVINRHEGNDVRFIESQLVDDDEKTRFRWVIVTIDNNKVIWPQ